MTEGAKSVNVSWQGVRLAAGELTLRVKEERRRRAVMLQDVGPLEESRMQGGTGAGLVLGLPAQSVPADALRRVRTRDTGARLLHRVPELR